MQKSPRSISSYSALEKLGRVRLSENFTMREMLYSSIGDYHGIPNYPDDPILAVQAGSALCQHLLEPLRKKFGHVIIRSAYRSAKVNQFGNENSLNCASNEKNAAYHIWDLRDADGNMGACATIQIPSFMDNYTNDDQWTSLAWWIHDNLPYNSQYYFNPNGTLNLGWRENPEPWIKSYVSQRTYFSSKSKDDMQGNHIAEYGWIEASR